ncbi:MspA family porin [Williamsia sterculiae]|uniref:MspA protein n=1 Tax=Williamsia sterculiae TaxID=1344003 RepID=A0A1N7DK45_9NOCA|nr:MspA family porin [Williamsia sterculiae]SIR76138.1 MspA protein [Williamsia sterculiae]
MSKFSVFGLRRTVGVAAIAAVAGVGLASMGAGEAAAGKLPNGYKKTVGADGTVAEIIRTGDAVYPVPSVSNNGAGRAAEVFGNIVGKVSGNGDGSLETGYLVGCQVDVSDLTVGLDGTADFVAGTAGLTGSLNIPIKPGQVVSTSLGSKDFKGVGAIQYQALQIGTEGCGGFAQARAYSTLTVAGDNYIKTTLYGKPFSIN